MKSFTCLFVVLIVAMSGLSFSGEPGYLDQAVSKSPAEAQIRDISGISGQIGPDIPNLQFNTLQQDSYIQVSRIPVKNPGVPPFNVPPGPVMFELMISSSGGGSVTSPGEGSFQYPQGADVSIDAEPDIGYEVDTWYLDGVDDQTGGTSYTLSIDGNHSVDVTFKRISFSITSSAGSNGSIDPDGDTTVNYGDNLGFTATPDMGYEVDTWFLDGVEDQTGGTDYTLTGIQANHTVDVTFRQLQYTIDASAGPHGSVSPSSVTVSSGGNQTFTATPDSGYEVDTWFLDGSVAQSGGTSFAVSPIYEDHTVHVTFKQMLSYSLDSIDFDDDEEFDSRVVNNNFIDPEQPENNRIHIERVEDPELDPNGVMLMHNLRNLDPTSSNYGRIVFARAKGLFIETGADEILIRFMYLFSTSKPGVEIVVYLSDSKILLDPDDPQRADHYLEVARIPAPPFPRPGSAGSGRFGVFEKVVWTGHLNFSQGVCVELELVEPDTSEFPLASYVLAESTDSGNTSAHIDNWSPAVQCYGICLDINWDNFVDEADFLMIIGGSGCVATGDAACLEGVFSADGYLDSYDVVSWDWALNSDDRLLNYCAVPLSDGNGGMNMMSIAVGGLEGSGTPLSLVDLPGGLGDLLIAGKKGAADAPSKLKDGLYVFNSDGLCSGWFEPALDRCNIRLLKGPDNGIYQLNSETGLLRLDSTDEVIMPPGKIELTNEPRYNKAATVYVGMQQQGSDSFGRPILDATLDADHIYVIPVVINPDGGEPYTAAAKLKLLDSGNPPYEVVTLYDDPPLLCDNQCRNNLREIELDNAGNLYVLNVNSLNESDILWKYDPNGTVERLDLGRPDTDSYLPAPVGMYASKTTDMLYLTSAEYNSLDSDSTVIYGFSTKGALALQRSITINGMQHVTGITEDPQTGTLWVVGFNMYNIPQYPNPTRTAFYYPSLAKITNDGNDIQLIDLFDPGSHDLALPMSIVWTGN